MSTVLENQVKEAQDAHDALEEEHGADPGTETVDEVAAQEPVVPPMQIPLEGFAESISMVAGGDKAKTASITLRGGKLNVAGEFKKGDVIELYVRARVAEIHFVDSVNPAGDVTGTERRHVAKPVAVRRLAASEE